MSKKPQQQMQDFDVEKPAEVPPLNMENDQEQQEENIATSRDSSEGISDGIKCPHANDGGSESQSPIDASSDEGTVPMAQTNGLTNRDNRQVAIVDDALNSTSDLSEPEQMPVELEVKSEVNDIPIEVDKLDMTICEGLPVGVVDEDINDFSTAKDEHDDVCFESLPAIVDDSAWDMIDSEISAMMELPVGMLDEEEKDDETYNSKERAQSENVEWIEELPVQLLDEDTAKSQVEKHDEAETREEVLPTETQLEQPQLEEHEKVQSPAESEGWVKIEFQKEDEPKEKVAQRKTQDDQAISAEDEEIETLAREKIQQFAESQLDAEHDGGLNGDAKLMEENDKLRKMMEKLLEAGNEQLSAISDLTGRVKDLEKKLARSRSKRVKTKRYRPTASKMSCMKSSK